MALVALIDSRPTTHERQMVYLRYMTEDSAALLALIGRHLALLVGRDCPVSYAALQAQPVSEREAWFVQSMASQHLPACTARPLCASIHRRLSPLHGHAAVPSTRTMQRRAAPVTRDGYLRSV